MFRKGLRDDYLQAIRKLTEIGTTEILLAEPAEDVLAILNIIAIAKDLRIHGRLSRQLFRR